jgi:hypothetical protein
MDNSMKRRWKTIHSWPVLLNHRRGIFPRRYPGNRRPAATKELFRENGRCWSQNKAWSKLIASFDMTWNSKLFETLLAFLSGLPPFQNSWCAGRLWGDSWLHDRERGHEWGLSVCPDAIPRNKSLRNPRREGHDETWQGELSPWWDDSCTSSY